jgi:hypothetical protein
MAAKRRKKPLDKYPWKADDPGADVHALIDPVLGEYDKLAKDDWRKKASDTKSWAPIKALSIEDAARAVTAAFLRMDALIDAKDAWAKENGTEAHMAPRKIANQWYPGINANAAVIEALLKRKVLLEEDVLFCLLVWAVDMAANNAGAPFLSLAAAVERRRDVDGISNRVRTALDGLRECLLTWGVRDKKLYARLDALIDWQPAVKAAVESVPTPQDPKLAKDAAALLDELAAAEAASGFAWYKFSDIASLAPTKRGLKGSPELQVALVRNAMERFASLRSHLRPPVEDTDAEYLNAGHDPHYPRTAILLAVRLLRRKLPFTAETLAYLAEQCSEKHAKEHGVTERQQAAYSAMANCFKCVSNSAETKLMSRLNALGRPSIQVPVDPGEAWSDAAIASIDAAPAEVRGRWVALIEVCAKASGGAPTRRWLDTARPAVDAIGFSEVKARALEWFPKVGEPRTADSSDLPDWRGQMEYRLGDRNENILKGLAWCCSLEGDAELARALAALAISAYKKLPGIGPRAVKLGNACLTALGQMPHESTVGHLAILKVRVKFRTAHKLIDRALTEAAERAGVSRSEIEELGLPTYGLTEVGRRHEEFGDYSADLVVTGSGATELRWAKAGKDKLLKSVPKAVKDEYPERLAELRSAAKDIQKLLPAQRQRIDGLFLQQREWKLSEWRERYLDHPLVGYLGRRIIWRFSSGGSHTDAVWHDGKLIDVAGKRFKPPAKATVSLWHPIDEPMETVLAWRELLESRGIVQPFKQAYREIYVLTDAERETASYSNRYAAHIIRQHQFNALCAAREWRNTLQLLVDDEFPPANRELPAWGIRAEFWCDGAGDEYDIDTNETGVFYRLATDQVRFFPMATEVSDGSHGFSGREARGGADPMPVAEVPPLVFSEIMRDVDLFVGVASVGNDPTWSDGGPEGRHREYWESYSFGELSATAGTRKTVLERLLPRLKIADRCTIDGRFLKVRGGVRTYKIHLGSGNILMEPNDQYLCIVKGRSTNKGAEKVMLPFEGDGTLSMILSKAFLLAADTKITDETILSQIRGG